MDFNDLVEAEIERHARQWEKTEERLQTQLDQLHDRIEQQKAAHADRKRVIDEARAVLDDFYGSDEPRSTTHAMQALRRIISGV